MGTFRARPEWVGDKERERRGRPRVTNPHLIAEALQTAPPTPRPKPATTPTFGVGTPWRPRTDYERETGQRQDGLITSCGATRRGLPCGRPRQADEPVCGDCGVRIARRVFDDNDRHRDWCAEQITDEEYERGQVRVAASRSEQRRARAADREASAVHVVYYLRVAADRIKIGTTGDLAKRLTSLYTDASAVLAVEPGDRTVEKRRHRQWAQWRTHTHREAFHDTPELLAFIAAVRAEHGDPSDYLHRSPDEEVS